MFYILCLISLFLESSFQIETKAFHTNIFWIKPTEECAMNISYPEYIMNSKILDYPNHKDARIAIESASEYYKKYRNESDTEDIHDFDIPPTIDSLTPLQRRDNILGLITLKFFFDRRDEDYLDRLTHKMYQVSLAFDEDTLTDVINNDLLPGDALLEFAGSLPCVIINDKADILEFPPVYVEPNDPLLLPSEKDITGQWYLGGRGIVDLFYQYGANVMQAWVNYRGENSSVPIAILGPGCSVHPDLHLNYLKHLDKLRSDLKSDTHPLFAENEPSKADWGTPASSMIAATTNNNYGGAGICWNCKLVCFKVYDAEGRLDRAAVNQALDWLLISDIRIILLAYTSDEYSVSEAVALESLAAKDVIVIVPAGNDNCDLEGQYPQNPKACSGNDEKKKNIYPASYSGENMITVGSSRMDGHKSKFSNWGKNVVDIMAPGEHLYLAANPKYKPGGYGHFEGTQFSAALVTGVAGLMLSYEPNLTAAEVKQIISNSSQSVKELKDLSATGGIIDALAAMKQIKDGQEEIDVPRIYAYPEPDLINEVLTVKKIESSANCVSIAEIVIIAIIGISLNLIHV